MKSLKRYWTKPITAKREYNKIHTLTYLHYVSLFFKAFLSLGWVAFTLNYVLAELQDLPEKNLKDR